MSQSSYAKPYPNIENGLTIVEGKTDAKQMVDHRVNEAIVASVGMLKRFLEVDKAILKNAPSAQLSPADADKLSKEKAQLGQMVENHNNMAATFDGELITKDILTSGRVLYRNSVEELSEVLSHFEDTTHFDPGMVYILAVAANIKNDSFIFENIDEQDKENILEGFDAKKAMIRGALNQFVAEGGNVAHVQFIATLQKKLLENIISDFDIAKSPYKDMLTFAVLSQDNQFPEEFQKTMRERAQKRLEEFDPKMVKNIAQSLINLEVASNELKDNSIPDSLMAGDDNVSKIIMNFTDPQIDLTNTETSQEVKGLTYLMECADRMSSASAGR